MGILSRLLNRDEEKKVTVVNGSLFGFSDEDNDEELIREGYASNADVYAIINKISSKMSSIPTVIVDEDNEEVLSGELYDLWQEPIKGVSQKEFINQSGIFLLSTGDLFYRNVKPIGFNTSEIKILPSGLVDIKGGNSYFEDNLQYSLIDKQRTIGIPSDQIIHVKYLNPTQEGIESYRGLSPLKAAYLSLTASNDINKGGAMAVKNQGVRGILSNKSDRALTKEENERLQDVSNSKLSGVSNFNKIFSTNANLSFIQLGMSPSDLKILELGILSLRQLCNAYSVASVLFNDSSNSKFANVHEAEKSLILNAALPNLENKILWSLNNSIVKEMNKINKTNYRIKVDTSKIEILQADKLQEAKKNSMLSASIVDLLTSELNAESKRQILISVHKISENEADNLIKPLLTDG